MATITEQRAALAVILALTGTLLILLYGGLELATMAGVFTGKQAVIENDQRITKQNLLDSASSATADPAKP
jgi:hypothetical protein